MTALLLQDRRYLLGLLVAGLVFGIWPLLADDFIVIVLTQCLIWGMFAMCLDLMLGYTGLASLGHAAYFGTGAYAAAIMAGKFQATFFEAFMVSVIAAAVVTAVFAIIALRAQGVYFLMITFALAMLVWGLVYRWERMTGGENGIAGIQRPVFIESSLAYHYFTTSVAILIFLFFAVLVRSSFGKTLAGIRESESRMRTLGYNVWLHKYIIYLVSGIISGLVGFIWAYYNSFVAPTDVEMLTSFTALLMVSLGGPGTLVGALIGSTLYVFLQNLVNIYTERWLTVVGLIYIFVVLFAPQGIIGLLQGLRKNRQMT